MATKDDTWASARSLFKRRTRGLTPNAAHGVTDKVSAIGLTPSRSESHQNELTLAMWMSLRPAGDFFVPDGSDELQLPFDLAFGATELVSDLTVLVAHQAEQGVRPQVGFKQFQHLGADDIEFGRVR